MAGFEAKYKVDPDDISNGNRRWTAFRAKPKTQFMRSVRRLAKARHQATPISVLAANPWCYRSLGARSRAIPTCY